MMDSCWSVSDRFRHEAAQASATRVPKISWISIGDAFHPSWSRCLATEYRRFGGHHPVHWRLNFSISNTNEMHLILIKIHHHPSSCAHSYSALCACERLILYVLSPAVHSTFPSRNSAHPLLSLSAPEQLHFLISQINVRWLANKKERPLTKNSNDTRKKNSTYRFISFSTR